MSQAPATPEAVLYQGLLNQLQEFLMALDEGFMFVARQKHFIQPRTPATATAVTISNPRPPDRPP